MVSFCPFGSYTDNTEQSKDAVKSNKIEVELHIISNPFRSATLFVFGTERAFYEVRVPVSALYICMLFGRGGSFP